MAVLSRNILYLALLSLLLIASAMSNEQCTGSDETCKNPETSSEDASCPSRELIIRCSSKHLDTNNNGKLERSELEAAINSLPWFARGVLKILGSVDAIMGKCDVDGDDAISMDYDMENNKEKCLATCFKRRAFKGAFFPDCA